MDKVSKAARYVIVFGAIVTVAFGLIALMVVLASPAQAQDEWDCDDFATQQEAQSIYSQDTSDPYDLDGNDDDGKACEDLPSGSSSTSPFTGSAPSSGSAEPSGAAAVQYQYGESGFLPATGGGSLLAAICGTILLAGGGWLAYRLVK
jgi:hypothetical protein